MSKLTTQAGGISLGRAVGALAGLATAMVLSRWLTQEAYGTYRQLWLIFFTLAPIFELGIPPSASYFIPQLPRERLKTYFYQNGLLLIGSGVLVGLVFLSFAGPLARVFRNPELVLPLRAFALFPALTLPFNLAENSLVALNRAGRAGLLCGGAALLQAAIILLAFHSGASIDRVFLIISLWALVRWLFIVVLLQRATHSLSIRWNRAQLRDQLVFALPMSAAAMVALVSRQVDKIVISSSFSPERFAIYANGSYDIPLINVLTLSVTAVLVPAIVRADAAGDRVEIRRLWHGAARRMAWIFFPATCFLFIAAEPLMVVLFSADYIESAGPFRVFLFMLPLRILFHSGFLRALGRTRPIFVSALGSLMLSVLLSLALVRVQPLGLLGPAIAGVIAAYWAVGYSIRVIIKALGWRLSQYFPWRTLGAIALVALAAAVPAALLGYWLREQSAFARLALMGVIYGGFYLAIGEATGAARAREWRLAIEDLIRQR